MSRTAAREHARTPWREEVWERLSNSVRFIQGSFDDDAAFDELAHTLGELEGSHGIGGTDVFLIGHGYAPVITIRDGEGEIATGGPTVFLPTDQSFASFGVVKAPDASPNQIGLEGTFYPTFAMGQDEDGNLTGIVGDL